MKISFGQISAPVNQINSAKSKPQSTSQTKENPSEPKSDNTLKIVAGLGALAVIGLSGVYLHRSGKKPAGHTPSHPNPPKAPSGQGHAPKENNRTPEQGGGTQLPAKNEATPPATAGNESQPPATAGNHSEQNTPSTTNMPQNQSEQGVAPHHEEAKQSNTPEESNQSTPQNQTGQGDTPESPFLTEEELKAKTLSESQIQPQAAEAQGPFLTEDEIAKLRQAEAEQPQTSLEAEIRGPFLSQNELGTLQPEPQSDSLTGRMRFFVGTGDTKENMIYKEPTAKNPTLRPDLDEPISSHDIDAMPIPKTEENFINYIRKLAEPVLPHIREDAHSQQILEEIGLDFAYEKSDKQNMKHCIPPAIVITGNDPHHLNAVIMGLKDITGSNLMTIQSKDKTFDEVSNQMESQKRSAAQIFNRTGRRTLLNVGNLHDFLGKSAINNFRSAHEYTTLANFMEQQCGSSGVTLVFNRPKAMPIDPEFKKQVIFDIPLKD